MLIDREDLKKWLDGVQFIQDAGVEFHFLYRSKEWKDGGTLGDKLWYPGPDCQTFVETEKDKVDNTDCLVCKNCKLPLTMKVDAV